MRVFRTTRATANELLAQAQVDTDQAVYVVMMRGNFVVKRGPPGGNFPTGTELWVAWDPARKVGTDFGVGNGYPRWAQLGPGLSLDLE